MAASPVRTPKIRTACDRCYELKERCTRASVDTTCKRCDRIGLLCQTIRPLRVAGRRPQHWKQPLSGSTTSSQASSVPSDIDTWLQKVPDLSPEEKELLIFLLSRPKSMEYYVVSASFQAVEQRSLAAPLPAALPVLKDAYLACAGALKMLQPGIAEVNTHASLRRASSAMRTMRSLPVASVQDAALCLALGTALALFVYSAVGVGVADICHYCLSTTNPYMDIAMPDADAKSWRNFLVLLEIMECLVHRRKPTLRMQSQVFEGIDRHLGLCMPLMPYYYDLCVISHSLVGNSDFNYPVHLQKQLYGIQTAVEAWMPSFADDSIDQFKSAEIVNLLAQAKVYRLSCLLLSHRLQYKFGQRDSQAETWSKEVMMELELARQITKQPIRCVTLPFIIAAVEIRDPSARKKALRNVNEYVDQFSPVVQGAAKTFLSRVWHERDINVTCCWFDSVYKPCAVLHSIDAACFA